MKAGPRLQEVHGDDAEACGQTQEDGFHCLLYHAGERAAAFTFDLSVEPKVRLLDYGMQILPFDMSVEKIVRRLGNGCRISCQDTVPFCLWIAARHLDDYQLAIVRTIRAGGDMDTNAAIVGGLVALAVQAGGIPPDWLADREELVV